MQVCVDSQHTGWSALAWFALPVQGADSVDAHSSSSSSKPTVLCAQEHAASSVRAGCRASLCR